jgi:hypothetical protein
MPLLVCSKNKCKLFAASIHDQSYNAVVNANATRNFDIELFFLKT